MNYWSPETEDLLQDSDHIRAFSSVDGFSGQYDMDMLPPDDMPSLEDSLAPAAFFNDMIEDFIKPDPEWDVPSSSTPDSENLLQTEPRLPQPTHKARAKSRRNMSTSSESTSGTFPSSELSREKNRIAASKCRKKKKVEEKHLEERRRMLQVQNAILQDSANQLRDEVLHLKNEILRHGTCDYPPIQSYIETAAAQLRR